MAKKNKAQRKQQRQQKKQAKQKKKQIKNTYRQEKKAAKQKKKNAKKQLKQQAKAQTNYDVDAPALSETMDSATDALDNLNTAARSVKSSKKETKSFAEKMNNAKRIASNLFDKAKKAKDLVIANNPKNEINLDDMSDNTTTNNEMSTQSTTSDKEGFFSKYKIPIIITGTLLTIGGVVLALTRSSTPTTKRKLSGIDDGDIGDIEPIELS